LLIIFIINFIIYLLLSLYYYLFQTGPNFFKSQSRQSIIKKYKKNNNIKSQSPKSRAPNRENGSW